MYLRLRLVTTLVFFNFCSYSQSYIDYFNLVNQAEYYTNNKEYKQAISIYRQAFKEEPPILGKDLYLLAKCYAALGFSEKAIYFLKKSALYIGSYPSLFIQRDSIIFKKCFKYKAFNKIVFKLDKIERKRFLALEKNTKINKIRDTVDYFVKEDQFYRMHPKKELYRADTTKGDAKQFFKEWELHDSMLYEQFIDYVKNNGYPDYNTIGTDIASTILLHFSWEQYEKSKLIFYEELKAGRILPFHYASMIDRKEYQFMKACKYYIFNGYCKEGDYKKIIKDRLAIGMSIFYNGPRKFPFEETLLLPWVSKIDSLKY